jgi:Peptidase family M23
MGLAAGSRAILLKRYKSSVVLKRNALILILLMLSIYLSATDLLILKGEAVQGGFLIGELSDDVELVFWNYEKVNIFDNQFVLGFDRDEKLRHIVTLCEKNGEMHNIPIYLIPRKYYIQKINKIQKKYVKQPTDPELTKRIDKEADLLKETRNSINNNPFNYFDRFVRPIVGGKITGSFGNQRILNGVSKRPHNGIDIAVPEGTEIKAMTSGIVKITGDFFYNGKFVLIDHGIGLSSIYLHMNKINVEKGDYVVAGDKIGEVGSTGRSTGNHLHWGVNWYKKRIDPEALLKLDEVFLRFRRDESY